MTYRIVPASHDHVDSLAGRLREADRLEALAGGKSPAECMHMSLDRSDFAYSIVFDGVVNAIFGCGTTSVVDRQGAPWMLGADIPKEYRRDFLRGSIAWVDEMKLRYGRLANHVDARNTRAIRWLRWLGFEIGEPVPFGYLSKPFHPFSMESRYV